MKITDVYKVVLLSCLAFSVGCGKMVAQSASSGVNSENPYDEEITTPTTQPPTSEGTQPSGAYTSTCASAGENLWAKIKYTFTGLNVRFEQQYYYTSDCASLEFTEIYEGTATFGAQNGTGRNIDLNLTATSFFFGPNIPLANFNNPQNPFCARTNWVRGSNALEIGNPCRTVLQDYRVFSLAGNSMLLSAYAASAAERTNALSFSLTKE